MKDTKKVFEYTKKYCYEWKPETTITILRLIKDEYEINQDEITNMIKKMKVFSSIIKYILYIIVSLGVGYCLVRH